MGKFTEVDGVSCSRVARLNADGSVDSGFDTSTEPSGTSTGDLLQLDRQDPRRGSLPSGLTLARASGLLSGTPTTRATYLFTVTASNYTAPRAHQAVSLNVKGETLAEISAHTPDPSEVGQSVSVQYTVTPAWGTPSGDVTVSDGTANCMGTVASGSCTLAFSTPGTQTLTATYTGDANFASSVSTGVNHVVNAVDTTEYKVYLPIVVRNH